jgi:hypothetical protein
VLVGTTVKSVTRDTTRLTVWGGNGLRRDADIVLIVVGVRPNVQLAAAAGARLGTAGAIAVDEHMRTSVPDIYAAGDCVHTHHRLLPEPTYLPLGTTAHKQGRVAGENAIGGDRRFAGVLGTQVVKIFDRGVAATGLRDPEAGRAGYAPATIEATADDHKAYYPGATRSASASLATPAQASSSAPSWSATSAPKSPNASTCSPPQRTTATPSTSSPTSTCPTPHHSETPGTPSKSPPNTGPPPPRTIEDPSHRGAADRRPVGQGHAMLQRADRRPPIRAERDQLAVHHPFGRVPDGRAGPSSG